MKKKVKDLTLEKVKNICRNNNCVECPLQDSLCAEQYIPFIDFELDKEIEVDGDE